MIAESNGSVDLARSILFMTAFFALHWASTLLSPRLFLESYSKLSPSQQTEWHGRVVGSVFALAVLSLGVSEWASHGFDFPSCISYTPRSRLLTTMGVGFFTWDVVFCNVLSKATDMGVRAHSFLGLFNMLLMIQPIGASEGLQHIGACFMTIWEASTPFLNLRMQLLACGKAHTTLFALSNVMFALLFLGVRWGTLPFSVRWYMRSWPQWRAGECGPPSPMLTLTVGWLSFAGVAMNLLNVVWGLKVLKGIVRTFSPPPNEKGEEALKTS